MTAGIRILVGSVVLGAMAVTTGCYRGGAGNCAVACTTDEDCVGVTGTSCVPANAGRACGTGTSCVGVGGDAAPADGGLDAGPPSFRWRSVDVGGGFVLALGEDGELYCWGDNRDGQCGQPAPLVMVAPTQVPRPSGVTGWLQASAGAAHACAIATDGSGGPDGALYCWGDNNAFQTGATTSDDRRMTALAPGTPFRKAEAAQGGSHSCALEPGGRLRCWGSSRWGQLPPGIGSPRFNDAVPVDSVLDVEAGPFATCYLRQQGPTVTAVCLTTREAALRSPPALVMPTRIHVGSEHACVTDAAGAATCWGSDRLGEQGQGPGFIPGGAFAALATGANLTCGATTDGAVVCAGANDVGQLGDGQPRASADRIDPIAHPPLTGIQTLSIGSIAEGLQGEVTSNVCAIDDAARLWCWGDHDFQQLGVGGTGPTPAEVPPPLPGTWRSVATGRAHSCAVLDHLTTGPLVYCWGDNSRGQVAAPATTFGLTQPTAVVGLTMAVEVSTTWDHTCATTPTAVACWGANGNAQIDDSGVDHPTPTTPALTYNGHVGAGDRMTCSDAATCRPLPSWSCSAGRVEVDSFPLMLSGGVICDGGRAAAGGGVSSGWANLLELGSEVARPGAPPAANQVDPADSFTCAIFGGTLGCWGTGSGCALGGPAPCGAFDNNRWFGHAGTFTRVAAAAQGGCAINAAGKVRCWGNNWRGETGIGFSAARTLSYRDDVLASAAPGATATHIAYAEHHACAIVDDAGTSRLFCWGSNSQGQLGRPLPYPLALPVQVLDPQ